MEIITQYWHQVVFIVGLIIVAVRLSAQVKELRKDLDAIEKRDTYVETVKLRAEVDQLQKHVTGLDREWLGLDPREVGGPDGEPIKVQDVSDLELARRLGFILARGGDDVL